MKIRFCLECEHRRAVRLAIEQSSVVGIGVCPKCGAVNKMVEGEVDVVRHLLEVD